MDDRAGSAAGDAPRAAARPTVAAALVLLGLLAAIPAPADDGCTWSPEFSGSGTGHTLGDSGEYSSSAINVPDDFAVGSIRIEVVYHFPNNTDQEIGLFLAPAGAKPRDGAPEETVPEHNVDLGFHVVTAANVDLTLSLSSADNVALQSLIQALKERSVGASGEWHLAAAQTASEGADNEVVSWTLELATAPPPGAPAKLLPAAGAYQVELTWDDPEDHSITGWQYRHNTDASALDDEVWIDIDGSSAATTSHLVSGLALATTYHFQVRGCPGGAASETVSATTAGKAVRIDAPAAPQPVSAQAGAEVAALAVQLTGDGGEVEVTSFSVKVQAGGAGKVADIARVKVYRDVNDDGVLDAGDQPVGQALNAAGEVTIGTGGLTVAPDDQVHLLFALQFEPTLSAAGGGLLAGLLGGLLALAAARRRRQGGRTRRAGRMLAAALLAAAVVGCQAALTEPHPPPRPQAHTYQLTLTAIEVASGSAVAGLPEDGITGPPVTIEA